MLTSILIIIALILFVFRVTLFVLRLKGRILGFLLGGLFRTYKRRHSLPSTKTTASPRDLVDPTRYRV